MYLPDDLPTGMNPRSSAPALAPPRRISEADLAFAIQAWLRSGEFRANDAAFRPYDGLNLKLRAHGDILQHGGHPVITRSPRPEVLEGPHTAELMDARAICRVVLRGDAEGLYGWTG